MKRRSIAVTSLLLLPFQIVFRAGEAVFPLLLAAWFGSTSETDVYYFSLAYFTFVGSLSFGIFRDSVLVPLLAEVRLEEPELMPRVAGSFLAHTLVYGTALSVTVGALAWGWFRLRYAGADLVLATSMVAPFAAYLVALSVKTFFIALLNAHHRYFAHPVAAALGVGVTIGVVYVTRDRMGVASIPLAAFLGELLAAVCLAVVTTTVLRMRMVLSLDRPAPVRRFLALALPDVAGGAVTRVNPVVDQAMIGATGVVGGGTIFKQAGGLADLPTSLLQAALLPVLLSHLADEFAGGRLEKFRSTVVRSLVTVCGLLALVAAGLYVVRDPVLRFVFQRGEMAPSAVTRMVELFPYYLVGIVPFGALLVLARAHVAVKNTKIMLPMGALNALLHATFNVALVRPFGLGGLALSNALVSTVIAVVFWGKLEAWLDGRGEVEVEDGDADPLSGRLDEEIALEAVSSSSLREPTAALVASSGRERIY